VAHANEIAERADILQIGTRNYQNFDLLEAVGKTRKPILYKRGISAELEEWLSAAEYIALSGNKNIILCERGVKSTVHGDYNRSHIDFDVIPAVKNRTILPIVIDPSHSSGTAELVPYQFCGASVYGANGTLVEVVADDTDRKTILCDPRQGVRISVYEKMLRFQLEMEKIGIRFE
jgi:3-deoxy-7-phosphoheptulonate synthase